MLNTSYEKCQGSICKIGTSEDANSKVLKVILAIEEFFIRTNLATEKLELRKLNEYTKNCYKR